MNGASFCQVIRMKQFIHDKPSITEGNHIWKGAAPIFNRRVKEIIEFINISFRKGIIKLKMIKVNIRDEAIA